MSYLDETAMNVAQELGDSDLYNYDILVKLLSDRFDPASRVSAFRSRFHDRSRRHHEDAFADALAELCRVGYPQSPPELCQELIAEQFVRGQSYPELKKYLWVVIRTQKDRKLQMLIEVCTDFSSLVTPTHLHRPAEQTFAVHHHFESYTEEDEESEDVFAIGDRPSWNDNRRSPDPSASPILQQMFTLARRMGYEMRPIARQTDVQRRPLGNRPPTDHNRGFRPQTPTNRDYSRIKCFSCGEFGHMQTHCPTPDSSLPFKPAGWHLQSDNRPQRDGNNNQGNSLRRPGHDWQVQCQSVLKEIYGHLCIIDVAVKNALTDSGPRPFVLKYSTQQGGFCDTVNVHGTIVNNALIETRVDLAAGRLTTAEWLQPTAKRGGLRNAAC